MVMSWGVCDVFLYRRSSAPRLCASKQIRGGGDGGKREREREEDDFVL